MYSENHRKKQKSFDMLLSEGFIFNYGNNRHCVNVSVLIRVFTKVQCFYLNYHKFSIKSYVLDVYKNRLGEAILIHIHNI